ncbi:unnamed protein product [Microthlaspi erraticum]|uniref:Uncharacterized protein n=1 Tax=Microthlaspi erraticum TaxID=1685480 RepID=A0A6D2JKM4_9BRAS|nr:unnamed protein product [Microthlaspi erraticum]
MVVLVEEENDLVVAVDDFVVAIEHAEEGYFGGGGGKIRWFWILQVWVEQGVSSFEKTLCQASPNCCRESAGEEKMVSCFQRLLT